MNAYFQNLIERNMRAPGDIRPRIPSVFESAAQTLPFPHERETAEHQMDFDALPVSENKVQAKRPGRLFSSRDNLQSPPSVETEKQTALTKAEERTESPQSVFQSDHAQARREISVAESLQNVSRLFENRTGAAHTILPVTEKPFPSETIKPQERTAPPAQTDRLQKTGSSAGESFSQNETSIRVRLHPDKAKELSAPAVAPAENNPSSLQSQSPAAPTRRITPRSAGQADLRPLSTMPTATRNEAPAAESFPRSAEPEKTIRVTIGRIDVRAVMPPSPAPAARPKETQPKISLEDYLKKQRGGSR